MKKCFSNRKSRQFYERRAAKQLKRRLLSRERRKRVRRVAMGPASNALTRRRILADRSGKHTPVLAPAVFSFIKNTPEMIVFIEKVDTLWRKRRPVWIILRDVEEIDYGGILVLLSVMIRFKARGVKFNGDWPLSQVARDTLASSGFFTSLGLSFNDRDHYKVGSLKGILTHAHRNVEAELTDRVLGKAAQIIWGKPARCQGAQRVFLELMQNTNNHASLAGRGEKHWWLAAHHDSNKHTVSFAFVDYGVGVFKSLRSKQAGDKFFGVLEKMLIGFRDNLSASDADVLKKILEGELHRTASRKYYRGKGLPGIKEALDRGWIANLHIITNKVRADVARGSFELMTRNFEGTFLHWEISTKNLHCFDDEP